MVVHGTTVERYSSGEVIQCHSDMSSVVDMVLAETSRFPGRTGFILLHSHSGMIFRVPTLLINERIWLLSRHGTMS